MSGTYTPECLHQVIASSLAFVQVADSARTAQRVQDLTGLTCRVLSSPGL